MAKTSVYRWVEITACWNSGPSHWEWEYIYLPDNEATHKERIDDMIERMIDTDTSFHNHGFRNLTWEFKTPPDDYIQEMLSNDISHCRALLKRNRSMRSTLSNTEGVSTDE